MASASDLDRGMHFRFQNNPYRVVRKEVVAVGTHSHTKIKIFGRSLFGGGEKSFIFSHSDKVDLLDIMRKQAQVISKQDDKIQIMDMQSYETFDSITELTDISLGDTVIFVILDGHVRVLEKL